MNRQGPGKIEWTDYTWSPVTGCKHGCDYCYANKIAQRIYPERFEPTFRPNRLGEPATVRKPSKIFVCDMGDLFGAWVPRAWIECVLGATQETPEHQFQFLTKNPDGYIGHVFEDNAWLGVTWDGSHRTAKNIAVLVDDVDCPCGNIKFASFEPLLASYDHSLSGLDWIIIGERSDTPYDPQVEVWAKDLIERARELNISVFVKNRLKAKFPIQEFPKV